MRSINPPYSGNWGVSQRTFQPIKNPAGLIQARQLLLIFLLISLITLELGRTRPAANFPPDRVPVWGNKPVLGYFIFTGSLFDKLRLQTGLSSNQLKALQIIAEQETSSLQLLEEESLAIISNPALSFPQKRLQIQKMGYNQRVGAILAVSQNKLRVALGEQDYRKFVSWIENQWNIERQLHSKHEKGSAPRTFRVFATRYDSKGASTVALPDQCLKLANGGHHTCDNKGYVSGQGYSIYIRFKKSLAVQVGEAGPWNVDDNYWSSVNDPQPRRMFADLALGMPEAQAAYFNGYNGGVDQFGRKVTAPFGIDLSNKVADDLGLKPKTNEWVDVSFLWTKGWDKASTPKPKSSQSSNPTQLQNYMIQISTPNPDGSVIHIVQSGDTLWGIAAAYKISLGELYGLNNLTSNSVIQPGQKLVIKQKGPSSTPYFMTITPVPDSPRTPTIAFKPPQASNPPESTGFISSQIPASPTIQAGSTEITLKQITPTPKKEFHNQRKISLGINLSGIDPWLLVIGSILVTGILLLVVGKWIGNRK